MYKERLDICVMVAAAMFGLAVSIGGNPLTGVIVLVAIMAVWTLLPHLPVFRKFMH